MFFGMVSAVVIALLPGNHYMRFAAQAPSPFNSCDKIGKKNDTVFLGDEIVAGTYNCIKKFSVSKINIDQNIGGITTEGIVLGEIILKRNIDVHVEKKCISTCVLLVISSNNSSMCESAALGIHARRTVMRYPLFLYIPSIVWDFNGYLVSSIHDELLEKTSVDIEFYKDKVQNTPSDELYWINSSEALKYGFVKVIKNC